MNNHMKQELMAKTPKLIGMLGYLEYIKEEIEWMREEAIKGKDVSKDIQQVKHEFEMADLLLEDYARS